MKIGILTLHRSHNYGALLQAIALRKELTDMGHDVKYEDYYPDYEINLYTLYNHLEFRSKSTLKKKLGFVYKTLRRCDLLYRWLRIRNFKRFRNHYLEPYFINTSEYRDVVIYGSDQLWRIQPFIGEFDPVYFGANDFNTPKHVSYAVSLPAVPTTEEDMKVFNELVSHQNKISVREKQTQTYLEKQGFKDVSVSVDPTLLLDANVWDDLIPRKRLIEEKYILVYDLQGDERVEIFKPKYLRELAEKSGCKIVYLRDEARNMPTKYDRQTAAPDDFLNLIRYAECVLTSSFHGMIFAIIFKKLFYSAQTYGVVRTQSILQQLGLLDRLLSADEIIDDIYKPIDYKCMDEKLGKLRESSIEYLQNITK